MNIMRDYLGFIAPLSLLLGADLVFLKFASLVIYFVAFFLFYSSDQNFFRFYLKCNFNFRDD